MNIEEFFPDAGTIVGMKCEVCGSNMDVKRDECGPTTWAMSVTNSLRKYDHFYCPHIKEAWHKHARELRMEQASTKSPSLKEIFEKDIQILMRANLAE